MRHVLNRIASYRLGLVLTGGFVAGAALAATPASMRSVTRFDALPLADERLAQPVWLPHCRMQIVEWRPTASLADETSMGPQALSVIDATCEEAFRSYGAFLRSQGLPQPRAKPTSLPTMSLLPGNVLLDGASQRALNDLPSRFAAVAPRCCYWGLYVDSIDHVFLRNDPLMRGESGTLDPNPAFVRTLTHELSHVLSSRLGVWDVLPFEEDRDERLAEAFVAFMGLGLPVESSSEDLEAHTRFAAPRSQSNSRSNARHD